MPLQQHQSQPANQRQTLRRSPLAHPILILAKADVQLPVQVVLDAPVAAQRLAIGLRRRFAADEVTQLFRHRLPRLATLTIIQADHPQPRPVDPFREAGRIDQDRAAPLFRSAVAALLAGVGVVLPMYEKHYSIM